MTKRNQIEKFTALFLAFVLIIGSVSIYKDNSLDAYASESVAGDLTGELEIIEGDEAIENETAGELTTEHAEEAFWGDSNGELEGFSANGLYPLPSGEPLSEAEIVELIETMKNSIDKDPNANISIFEYTSEETTNLVGNTFISQLYARVALSSTYLKNVLVVAEKPRATFSNDDGQGNFAVDDFRPTRAGVGDNYTTVTINDTEYIYLYLGDSDNLNGDASVSFSQNFSGEITPDNLAFTGKGFMYADIYNSQSDAYVDYILQKTDETNSLSVTSSINTEANMKISSGTGIAQAVYEEMDSKEKRYLTTYEISELARQTGINEAGSAQITDLVFTVALPKTNNSDTAYPDRIEWSYGDNIIPIRVSKPYDKTTGQVTFQLEKNSGYGLNPLQDHFTVGNEGQYKLLKSLTIQAFYLPDDFETSISNQSIEMKTTADITYLGGKTTSIVAAASYLLDKSAVLNPQLDIIVGAEKPSEEKSTEDFRKGDQEYNIQLQISNTGNDEFNTVTYQLANLEIHEKNNNKVTGVYGTDYLYQTIELVNWALINPDSYGEIKVNGVSLAAGQRTIDISDARDVKIEITNMRDDFAMAGKEVYINIGLQMKQRDIKGNPSTPSEMDDSTIAGIRIKQTLVGIYDSDKDYGTAVSDWLAKVNEIKPENKNIDVKIIGKSEFNPDDIPISGTATTDWLPLTYEFTIINGSLPIDTYELKDIELFFEYFLSSAAMSKQELVSLVLTTGDTNKVAISSANHKGSIKINGLAANETFTFTYNAKIQSNYADIRAFSLTANGGGSQATGKMYYGGVSGLVLEPKLLYVPHKIIASNAFDLSVKTNPITMVYPSVTGQRGVATEDKEVEYIITLVNKGALASDYELKIPKIFEFVLDGTVNEDQNTIPNYIVTTGTSRIVLGNTDEASIVFNVEDKGDYYLVTIEKLGIKKFASISLKGTVKNFKDILAGTTGTSNKPVYTTVPKEIKLSVEASTTTQVAGMETHTEKATGSIKLVDLDAAGTGIVKSLKDGSVISPETIFNLEKLDFEIGLAYRSNGPMEKLVITDAGIVFSGNEQTVTAGGIMHEIGGIFKDFYNKDIGRISKVTIPLAFLDGLRSISAVDGEINFSYVSAEKAKKGEGALTKPQDTDWESPINLMTHTGDYTITKDIWIFKLEVTKPMASSVNSVTGDNEIIYIGSKQIGTSKDIEPTDAGIQVTASFNKDKIKELYNQLDGSTEKKLDIKNLLNLVYKFENKTEVTIGGSAGGGVTEQAAKLNMAILLQPGISNFLYKDVVGSGAKAPFRMQVNQVSGGAVEKIYLYNRGITSYTKKNTTISTNLTPEADTTFTNIRFPLNNTGASSSINQSLNGNMKATLYYSDTVGIEATTSTKVKDLGFDFANNLKKVVGVVEGNAVTFATTGLDIKSFVVVIESKTSRNILDNIQPQTRANTLYWLDYDGIIHNPAKADDYFNLNDITDQGALFWHQNASFPEENDTVKKEKTIPMALTLQGKITINPITGRQNTAGSYIFHIEDVYDLSRGRGSGQRQNNFHYNINMENTGDAKGSMRLTFTSPRIQYHTIGSAIDLAPQEEALFTHLVMPKMKIGMNTLNIRVTDESGSYNVAQSAITTDPDDPTKQIVSFIRDGNMASQFTITINDVPVGAANAIDLEAHVNVPGLAYTATNMKVPKSITNWSATNATTVNPSMSLVQGEWRSGTIYSRAVAIEIYNDSYPYINANLEMKSTKDMVNLYQIIRDKEEIPFTISNFAHGENSKGYLTDYSLSFGKIGFTSNFNKLGEVESETYYDGSMFAIERITLPSFKLKDGGDTTAELPIFTIYGVDDQGNETHIGTWEATTSDTVITIPAGKEYVSLKMKTSKLHSDLIYTSSSGKAEITVVATIKKAASDKLVNPSTITEDNKNVGNIIIDGISQEGTPLNAVGPIIITKGALKKPNILVSKMGTLGITNTPAPLTITRESLSASQPNSREIGFTYNHIGNDGLDMLDTMTITGSSIAMVNTAGEDIINLVAIDGDALENFHGYTFKSMVIERIDNNKDSAMGGKTFDMNIHSNGKSQSLKSLIKKGAGEKIDISVDNNFFVKLFTGQSKKLVDSFTIIMENMPVGMEIKVSFVVELNGVTHKFTHNLVDQGATYQNKVTQTAQITTQTKESEAMGEIPVRHSDPQLTFDNQVKFYNTGINSENNYENGKDADKNVVGTVTWKGELQNNSPLSSGDYLVNPIIKESLNYEALETGINDVTIKVQKRGSGGGLTTIKALNQTEREAIETVNQQTGQVTWDFAKLENNLDFLLGPDEIITIERKTKLTSGLIIEPIVNEYKLIDSANPVNNVSTAEASLKITLNQVFALQKTANTVTTPNPTVWPGQTAWAKPGEMIKYEVKMAHYLDQSVVLGNHGSLRLVDMLPYTGDKAILSNDKLLSTWAPWFRDITNLVAKDISQYSIDLSAAKIYVFVSGDKVVAEDIEPTIRFDRLSGVNDPLLASSVSLQGGGSGKWVLYDNTVNKNHVKAYAIDFGNIKFNRGDSISYEVNLQVPDYNSPIWQVPYTDLQDNIAISQVNASFRVGTRNVDTVYRYSGLSGVHVIVGEFEGKVFIDRDGTGMDKGYGGQKDIEVYLIKLDAFDAPGDVVYTTTTDTNGNYTFRAVPTGEKYIIAFKEPGVGHFTNYLVNGKPTDSFIEATKTLDLAYIENGVQKTMSGNFGLSLAEDMPQEGKNITLNAGINNMVKVTITARRFDVNNLEEILGSTLTFIVKGPKGYSDIKVLISDREHDGVVVYLPYGDYELDVQNNFLDNNYTHTIRQNSQLLGSNLVSFKAHNIAQGENLEVRYVANPVIPGPGPGPGPGTGPEIGPTPIKPPITPPVKPGEVIIMPVEKTPEGIVLHKEEILVEDLENERYVVYDEDGNPIGYIDFGDESFTIKEFPPLGVPGKINPTTGQIIKTYYGAIFASMVLAILLLGLYLERRKTKKV